MAQHLVYPNQVACLARTHAEALSRGCSPSGETQYWWAQVAHPNNGQWALIIAPSGDFGPASLSVGEQTALVSLATMQSNGWNL